MEPKTMFGKLWKDPVWSKVIATAIVAGAGLVYVKISGVWSALPSVTTMLIGIGSLCVVGLLCLVVWRYNSGKAKTLVFLSAGGTCRDPMAKAITNKLLENRKLKHPLRIEAAALGPLSKTEPSYAAQYVMKEMYNEDLLAKHRPQIISPELAEQADLILAMDRSLLLTPGKTLPKDKTFVLKDFFGIEGDVCDPWPDGKDMASLSRYRECAEELRNVLEKNLPYLIKVLDL